MAKIKRKSMSDISGAASMRGGRGYEKAARAYVNSGLKELNLRPQQRMDLKLKLQPLVEKQMKTERTRTLTRAEGISNRETKKKMSNAQKKIMGGK
jgi:hypothetical protein